MKKFHMFLVAILVSLMAFSSMAQDEWGSESGDEGSPLSDDLSGSGSASISSGADTSSDADADSDGGSMSYPGFSLGAKLELMNANYDGIGVITMTHPVLLDFSVDIISRLSVFAVMGTYLALSHAENSDFDEKQNVGILLLGGGVRFNIMEPRPKHAHLYLAADIMGGIGLASYDTGDDGDSEEEDNLKEQADHILFGAALGIEYLVVEEFGIGAEVAMRYLINRLRDTAPDVDFDKYYVGFIVTSFGLRIAYHF